MASPHSMVLGTCYCHNESLSREAAAPETFRFSKCRLSTGCCPVEKARFRQIFCLELCNYIRDISSKGKLEIATEALPMRAMSSVRGHGEPKPLPPLRHQREALRLARHNPYMMTCRSAVPTTFTTRSKR